uniref:Sphingomyelin phosphodiesterase-like n=2 Tax=Hirondellea gigas TaxID=1518452 RepID=A0A2P2I9G1_9CRUS
MLEILKPQISWILTNADLTGKDMCATLFTAENCQSDNPDRVWDVEMPDVPKPVLVVPDIPTDGPTIKVLHLADTHYDPEYLPGGNANCPELVFCCRAESGEVLHPNDAAGYWGDYRFCDSPRWTLESIYTHIQEQHPDISFIIWTGDLMPHNVWNTSREGNLKIIRDSVALVQEYFPGIPVFPAIGNHEAHPVNGYPQPYIDNEFDISWLYDEIADIWQTWLPANVAERIMYSASYVTEVFQNLRIISLNTNYCYSSNWWLLYDSNDPGEELYWLAQELQRAEDDGVFVYIISHIPTGDPNCQYSWSHQHNKIIARYEGVIAGLFYGHTHKDHFQVFFDPDQPDRTIEVAYIAESQTPYKKLNPGYKVYTVDAGRPEATYTVLDHENWYFDLDQANFEGSPTFQLLYTAKEEYGMSDLSVQSHLDLIYRMAANSTLFDLFYKNYVKAARPSLEGGCNSVCKDELLCKLITADRSDLSHCDTLP